MTFDNIPAEMRAFSHWVMWRLELLPNGKTTKRPYNVRTGKLASVDDPSTWATFQECVDAFEKFQNCYGPGQHGYSGIGYVFGDDDPFAGVDLDHTTDEGVRQGQHAIYSKMQSYTEYSQSGLGVHIIIKAKVPRGVRRHSVELYSSGRFFVMTGRVLAPAMPIREAQVWADELYLDLSKAERTEYESNQEQTYSDEDIYNKASVAGNGDKFVNLWNGFWNEYYPSASEGDIALANMLTFYSHNFDQVHRMFLASAAGKRDKVVQRPKYLRDIIAKSFDKKIAPLPIHELIADLDEFRKRQADRHSESLALSSNGRTADFDSVNLGSSPSNAATFPYALPPGLLGQLAQFVYVHAVKQVPEIALAAAIGLMSGVCGRAFNVSNTGLNLYTLLLAPTGHGKEGMRSGIDALLASVRLQVPTAYDVLGPGEIASGQALVKTLHGKPFFLTVTSEFGYKLRDMSSDRASSADNSLKRMLLDLYHKSGKHAVWNGMVYSNRDNNVEPIPSPALSILAESTPETFYKCVDDRVILDGLANRFLYVFANGAAPYNNDAIVHEPDPLTRHKFADLLTRVFQLMAPGMGQGVVDVSLAPDADSYMREFGRFCVDQTNSNTREVAKNFWNRAHLQTLKLAALVAVGVDCVAPVIQIEHAQWAKGVVVHSVTEMIKRYDAGELGNQTDNSAQYSYLVKVVQDFYRKPFESFKSYRVTSAEHALHLIPYAYLAMKTNNVSAFKNDRLGANKALKAVIEEASSRGFLHRVPQAHIKQQLGKDSGTYYVVADTAQLED